MVILRSARAVVFMTTLVVLAVDRVMTTWL